MAEANRAVKAVLINGNLDQLDPSEIENLNTISETSPSGNTLLHLAAAKSGHEELARALACKHPSMITKQNSQDDTPIHVAATAGMLETVKILVDCSKLPRSGVDVKSLMKMKNTRGNTALHEALYAVQDAMSIRSKRKRRKEKEEKVTSAVALARSLVTENPEASYLQNISGRSPLCLAVESRNTEILNYILEALPMADDCDSKLEGKSPVQVAIQLKELGMLQKMHEKQPALFRRTDEQGNTPMHWAASEDDLRGVRYLFEINHGSVLQRNDNSFYPFHLACENGCVTVMAEFFADRTNMPCPTELLTNKGQNILHVAAMNGRFAAVRLILGEDNIDKLINEMDYDGNTPLHLAASYAQPLAAAVLILDKRVKSDVANFSGRTAYNIAAQESAKINPDFCGHDVFEEEDQKKMYKVQDQEEPDDQNTKSKSVETPKVGTEPTPEKTAMKSQPKPDVYEMMMMLSLFFFVRIWHVFFRSGGTFIGNLLKLIEFLYSEGRQSPNKKDVNNRITNLIVVAALIAGASFAASVQVGSSSSSNDDDSTSKNSTKLAVIPSLDNLAAVANNGTAKAGGSDDAKKKEKEKEFQEAALKGFTFFNTVAMYTSITAAIVLCWAQLLDTNLASIDVWAASLFVVIALYASCFAFFTSIFMLKEIGRVFTVVIVSIQGVFLLILILRSFQLVVPLRFKKLLILFNYYLHLWVFYFVNWCWVSMKGTRCYTRCVAVDDKQK